MPSAERQLQISLRPTIPDLTSTRRNTVRELNLRTRGIARLHRQCASGKSVSKHVAQIVPDAGTIEVVCEDGLADVRLEDAIVLGGYLEGDAATNGIAAEHLAVGLVFLEDDFGPDCGADGPEVDGGVALVCDDCATGLGGDDEGCYREESEEYHGW